jgi:HTH-type transcriptional regulator/antitoxin HigA
MDFIDRIFPRSPQSALLRKTRTERTNAKTDIPALEAWCAAVLVKAANIKVPHVKKELQSTSARELCRLSTKEDGLARVQETLRKLGIIFVTLDHLPGTFLDGAALRRADGIPIIAMTLRYDRIDNFWFTLLHEFCHIIRHLDDDTDVILDDLEVKTDDDIESEADQFAQDTLIPPKLWQERVSAELTPEDVLTIAEEAEIHPAIVAGRWQREHKDYRRFAKLLGHGEVRSAFQQGSNRSKSN